MTAPLPLAQQSVPDLVASLAQLLLEKKFKLASAESCTGGLIASACTDLVGSSDWFERGFVTYSNEAKTELLGIEATLLQRDGAVSQSVAQAMVQGALAHSHTQVAVAVTGVAGPSGGSPAKPVGTVWFGFALPGQVVTEKRHFTGDRSVVRAASVQHALARLVEILDAPKQ